MMPQLFINAGAVLLIEYSVIKGLQSISDELLSQKDDELMHQACTSQAGFSGKRRIQMSVGRSVMK